MKSPLCCLSLVVALAGCNAAPPSAPVAVSAQTLADARRGFQTKLVAAPADKTPADVPPAGQIKLIKYPAAAGPTGAYLTSDMGDGKKHPAIVWITGGDNNSIGDVWSPNSPDNDQSAAQFANAGIVMMVPAQRGGNDNPGAKEGFLGEADDVVAAAKFLAKQSYVDPQRIYLGGHSTGGTLALLVAEQPNPFRAIFAFGPVEDVAGYGTESGFLPFDVSNDKELELRAPMRWLSGIQTPTYVFEGDGETGNIDSLRLMKIANTNPKVQFFEVKGRDHFSALAPVNTFLARQIVAAAKSAGDVQITQAALDAAVKDNAS